MIKIPNNEIINTNKAVNKKFTEDKKIIKKINKITSPKIMYDDFKKLFSVTI